MQIRRFLVAFALAAVSSVTVARLQPLHADDICDDCEILSLDGGIADDMGGTDGLDGLGGFEDTDESGRRCGDYDGALCGGTTSITSHKCTEWKVTSVSGTVSIVGQKPLSIELGGSLTCAAWTDITRTIQNRWDRTHGEA